MLRQQAGRILSSIALAMNLIAAAPGAEAQLRLNDFNFLRDQQKWELALRVIREEIGAPVIQTPDYLANLRILALGALAENAKRFGLQPGFDEEAARYFKEGMQYNPQGEEFEINLSWTYARYFSHSQRPGLAMPHVKKCLDHWTAKNNTFMVFLATDGLGTAYADSGELGLANHFWELASAAASKYFVTGEQSVTEAQWLAYYGSLQQMMNRAAGRRDPGKIEQYWNLRREISERNKKILKASGYMHAAEAFAIAGAADRAAQLLAESKRIWASESASMPAHVRRLTEMDLRLKEGILAVHAGRYREAIESLEAGYRERQQSKLLEQDFGLHVLRGRAFEGSGNLQQAADAFKTSIQVMETARQSYSIPERAAFFRSGSQRAYHGLIRVAARQAASGGAMERFWEAVQASEQIRARQLGDLIDPQASPTISVEALEGLRRRLAPSEAVVYFTTTERELVILAFTRDGHRVVVEPVNEAALSASVHRLARNLAHPDSALSQAESELLALSKTMLGRIADLLQARTDIIALPDGVLNLVPFDILSLDAVAYRPLMETHRVRLAPSLRFLAAGARSPATRGLFAVADPAYKLNMTLAGLSRDELKAATRGSRFLDSFAPLPETRTEAEAIGRTFKGDRVEMLLGAQATESSVKSRDLSSYAYLHFATHGILGGDVPGVGEPALVLADEPGEDGFLTASEVSALKLNARLTVLSACNTGSGEYVAGEGVMGLSRAFLLAGSSAVVMSLWPVASAATERLMVKFYANLRSGQRPDEALRDAKLALRDEARKSNSIERHPFFWAPFVYFGD